MIKKELPSHIAAMIVVLALTVIGLFEWNVLRSTARPEHATVTLTKAECTRCHSDADMLAKMKDKEQGSSHPLFADVKARLSRSVSALKCPRQKDTRPSLPNSPG